MEGIVADVVRGPHLEDHLAGSGNRPLMDGFVVRLAGATLSLV